MGKAQGQNFQNFDRLLLLKRKRGKSSFASTWNLRDVCGVCEKSARKRQFESWRRYCSR